MSDSMKETKKVKKTNNSDFTGMYMEVASILESDEELKVSFVPGKKLKFPVYLSQSMEETPIDCLELSVRSTHCLKRAGINTIGTLCERVSCSSDLNKLRNCGAKSRAEIMEKLFVYQYKMLSSERQKQFIRRVREMNGI